MQNASATLSKENMQQKVEQFAGQVVTDLAAAMAGVMTNLGHKLGLYRAMAESGAISSHELARRTETNERSVREWLNGQVAGGYVQSMRKPTSICCRRNTPSCWRIRIARRFFRRLST